MDIVTNKKELVFSNSLVCGKYNLTKSEQNLIYLVASQINKSDDDFKQYKVTISDLDLATSSTHDRRAIKGLMDSIMGKSIWLDKEQTEITNWFSYLKSVPKENALMCEFHRSLKPHLLGLKGFFTKAELSTIFAFKSKYSSRLYLLLKSELGRQSKHNKSPVVVYDVADLHNRFSMPKSYNQYFNFKPKFLDLSVAEINEHTELNISYKELKAGRKITSIEFCISEKEKTSGQLTSDKEKSKTMLDYIPESISSKSLEVLTSDELNLQKHDIKKIFDHYQINDVEQICDQMFKSWDNKRLMSRIALFRGKFKKLNDRKKQNFAFDFGFDEVKKISEELKARILKEAKGVCVYDDRDDYIDFLRYKLDAKEINKDEYEQLSYC